MKKGVLGLIGSLQLKTYDYVGDGIAVFNAVKHREGSFFLDSSMDVYGLGRFSFIGFDPFLILKKKDKKPFQDLRNALNKFKVNGFDQVSPLPAGAVGFFGYDLGLLMEKVPLKATDDLLLPDSLIGFYDVVITIDHWQKKLHIFSSGLPEKNSILAKRRAVLRLKETIRILSEIEMDGGKYDNTLPVIIAETTPCYGSLGITSNFSKQQYLQIVQKALRHIAAGDIYQVNLSQRFALELPRSFLNSKDREFAMFKLLRNISPSSFGAFFNCEDFTIISSSPERFLQVRERNVITRPMKGTRARGSSSLEDKINKKQLLNSKKDSAELLMIVDLLRNDLGRVCEYGSVKVKEMRKLETYNTVFQTTSTVEGLLHKDKDRVDLLKACFPGGSITGCPKIRSMQIIEELEPTRRSVYTGSLGYLSFSGNMDLNILIRTLLAKDDKVYFQVGGGIVADSKPDKEYQETLIKAKALFSCLQSQCSEKAMIKA